MMDGRAGLQAAEHAYMTVPVIQLMTS